MKARATIRATNERPFSAKAQLIPSVRMTTAASTGPTARARLKVTEFRAMAPARSCGSTSRGTRACKAGMAKAIVRPRANAKRMTTGAVATSARTRTAIVRATPSAHSWVTTRRSRRSKRSAARPAHEARRKTPVNWAKLTTPTRNVEWVSRKTRMAWAMFWNQLPQLESRFPKK